MFVNVFAVLNAYKLNAAVGSLFKTYTVVA